MEWGTKSANIIIVTERVNPQECVWELQTLTYEELNIIVGSDRKVNRIR